MCLAGPEVTTKLQPQVVLKSSLGFLSKEVPTPARKGSKIETNRFLAHYPTTSQKKKLPKQKAYVLINCTLPPPPLGASVAPWSPASRAPRGPRNEKTTPEVQGESPLAREFEASPSLDIFRYLYTNMQPNSSICFHLLSAFPTNLLVFKHFVLVFDGGFLVF